MTSTRHLIANRYTLVRQLAAGSYAETWLATDLALDRNVAIKRLHSRADSAEGKTERFLREARIAASVSHPNIVAVFDAGSEDGQPFLVMEWVNGTSLKQTILQSRRIDLNRVIAVSTQLLDGLSAIHAMGIIHRDIKPHNVMVSESGTVKLTDFGIARLMDEAEASADGMTAGSAAYMAPEQAQGLPVSPASDIYAAGVILYELLTGRLPFTGTDPHEVMRKHITESVIPPRRFNPAIPPELEAITMRALAKDPLDRFHSADDMRYELLWSRRSVPVRRPAALAPAPKIDWALPRFAWMAASVTLVMVMIVGAASLAVRDASTTTDTAAELPSTTVTPAPTLTALPDPTPTTEPSWVTTMREASRGETELPENDEVIVRGEIQIAGVPEAISGINRPAPTIEETDDGDEPDRVTASTGTGGYAIPTPPPPPPSPVEEDEPAEEEPSEEEVTEEDPDGEEEEGSSEQPADEEQNESESENGNQNGSNGEGDTNEQQDNDAGNTEGQNDGDSPPDHINNNDDAPSTNQQSDDDDGTIEEDPPAASQGQDEDVDAETDAEPLEDHSEETNGDDVIDDDVDDVDDDDIDADDPEEDDEVELTTARSTDDSRTS